MSSSHDPLPEPTGELLHERSYDVKAYREGVDRLRMRGKVRDQKPAGLLIPEDTEPLEVHLMVADLLIDFPSLTIVEATVVMPTTPHTGCTNVETDYKQLVGLSIARGFSRQVKDLFGGPRGCTHVGALLQAMAPAVIQSTFSMHAKAVSEAGMTLEDGQRAAGLRESLRFNLDTCHIWAEDGPMVAGLLSGKDIEIPLWAQKRYIELGREPEDFRNR